MDNHFPTLLRTYRKSMGWTQEELSEKWSYSFETISAWERGKRTPGNYEIPRLAKFLEIPPEELAKIIVNNRSQPLKKGLRNRKEPAPAQVQETPEQISTPGLNPLCLTEDQLTAFASLLKLGETIMFDPTKRKTLETLLAALSLAMVKPQGLLQPEAFKHILEPETNLARINEVTIQGYAKLIEACWQLSKGNELALAEKLLPECMTKLVPIAQQPSKYQQSAAHLAAQGFHLYRIFALHENNLSSMEPYGKQAIQYGLLSGDQNLLIPLLRGLGITYYYGKQYISALQTYENTLQYTKEASPLLQAAVYMSLAVAYAHVDQNQESLRYLGLALDTFPDNPEADRSFSYAEFGVAQMILWEGVIRSKIGQTKQALDIFKRIEQPTLVIPERSRLAIINQHAKTAILAGDLEQGATSVEAVVTGAKILGSQRDLSEAYDNYKQITLLWPMEKRVKELGELFYA